MTIQVMNMNANFSALDAQELPATESCYHSGLPPSTRDQADPYQIPRNEPTTTTVSGPGSLEASLPSAGDSDDESNRNLDEALNSSTLDSNDANPEIDGRAPLAVLSHSSQMNSDTSERGTCEWLTTLQSMVTQVWTTLLLCMNSSSDALAQVKTACYQHATSYSDLRSLATLRGGASFIDATRVPLDMALKIMKAAYILLGTMPTDAQSNVRGSIPLLCVAYALASSVALVFAIEYPRQVTLIITWSGILGAAALVLVNATWLLINATRDWLQRVRERDKEARPLRAREEPGNLRLCVTTGLTAAFFLPATTAYIYFLVTSLLKRDVRTAADSATVLVLGFSIVVPAYALKASFFRSCQVIAKQVI